MWRRILGTPPVRWGSNLPGFRRRGTLSDPEEGTPYSTNPAVGVGPERPEEEVPTVREMEAEGESKVYVASQWKLVWWRYRQSPLGIVGLVMVVALYAIAAFAPFLAPFPKDAYSAQYTYAPPQKLHFFDTSNGGFSFSPYVEGYKVEINQESLAREFTTDPNQRYSVGFLVQGAPYTLFGFIHMNRHLIGPTEQGKPMYLLGADRNGRDMLSRLLYGARISLSIGLIGVAISTFLGILLGGISGYFSGTVDLIIQRIIEFIGHMPTIPLWLGLSAAIPANLPALWVYFAITIILSIIGWTGLARTVRGKFLALRTDDFVTAARLDGAGEIRIILRHILPSFMSHIIATLTIALPAMILGETSLSFLGLGLRPPIVSWGVLLNEAQNVRTIATAPWLLAPGIAVIITVMAFYFVGDGLRDAADPYAT